MADTRKRARTGKAVSARKRAIAIASKINQRFPYSRYGRAYYLRGGADSLTMFGSSAKEATPTQKENRQDFGFYGRGKYGLKRAHKFSKSSLGKKLIRTGVGMAARYAGVPVYTGSGLYTGSSTFSGRGMYNHLIEGGTQGAPPTYSSGSDEQGNLILSNVEFVRDVYGNGPGVNFQNTGIELNPGNSNSFPQLSAIAQNFEEYEFVQLLFLFESKISDQLGGSNGQVGSLIMFTDYGPNSKVKETKQQMLQGYGAQDSVITNNQTHGIECDPAKLHGDGHKFVRSRPVSTHENKVDFDLGLFQYAVYGTPSTLENQIIGQLRVAYTIKLKKQRIYTQLGWGIDKDQWVTNCAAKDSYDAMPMTTSPMLGAQYNSIGTVITQSREPDQQTQTTQKVKITFPASFSGPVEIVCKNALDQQENLTDASWNYMISHVDLSGNVTEINDLDVTPHPGIGTTVPHYFTSVGSTYGGIGIIHANIEMASSGVDNTIEIWFTMLRGSTTDPLVSGSITIARYNNWESNKVPTYVDADGDIVTPLTFEQ